MIQQIDTYIENQSSKKKTSINGLLSPSEKKASNDSSATANLARYVSMIRKQKQEVLNGR
jgi:hypothetical protein